MGVELSVSADLSFRIAGLSDLDSLVNIEDSCFTGGRLSRRSFRRWIQAPHALLLLALKEQTLIGYGLVWCYTGSRVARLYSLAVLPEMRGAGISAQLLEHLEQACLSRGYRVMRLEVAESNQPAISLYQRCGYQVFGEYADYYADHSNALRMEKVIYDVA
ncbi:MAG: GNAT family N-acetyltransferase [Thiolinea sp.]